MMAVMYIAWTINTIYGWITWSKNQEDALKNS